MERVDQLDDPRIAPFCGLKERDIARQHGLFIAEGENLLKRLLASRFAVHSVLLAERRVEAILPLLLPGTRLYVASQAVMDGIIGYKFHSGIISAGVRQPSPALGDLVKRSGTVRLVVCPDLNSAENLGSLIRLSAGFGATALLVGPRSTDPFLRHTVRVSMGTIFTLPVIQSQDLFADVAWLKAQRVYCVASVLDSAALPLSQADRHDRLAIFFGGEAYGLDQAMIDAADQTVTIPMHLNTDSLNVAVAAGIFMYHFWS